MHDKFSKIEKDESIVRTLLKLERVLGIDAFQIADHWGADLRAIGIAHPRDAHQLVYIFAGLPGIPEGYYDVELETAPSPGSELPYASARRFKGVSFDELVGIVQTHFQSASSN